MNRGGLSGALKHVHSQMRLSLDRSGARLLAFAASAVVHLLGIAALASSLHAGIEIRHLSGPVLPVISLTTRPSMAMSEKPKPKATARTSPHPRRNPDMAMHARVADAVTIGQGTTAAPMAPMHPAAQDLHPAPPAAPFPAEPVAAVNRQDQDLARKEYQMAVWRRIDASHPRADGASGTVLIRFQLTREGTISAASIARTSGNVLLDRIALRALRQAGPFPLPPADMPLIMLLFEIPIRFH